MRVWLFPVVLSTVERVEILTISRIPGMWGCVSRWQRQEGCRKTYSRWGIWTSGVVVEVVKSEEGTELAGTKARRTKLARAGASVPRNKKKLLTSPQVWEEGSRRHNGFTAPCCFRATGRIVITLKTAPATMARPISWSPSHPACLDRKASSTQTSRVGEARQIPSTISPIAHP